MSTFKFILISVLSFILFNCGGNSVKQISPINKRDAFLEKISGSYTDLKGNGLTISPEGQFSESLNLDVFVMFHKSTFSSKVFLRYSVFSHQGKKNYSVGNQKEYILPPGEKLEGLDSEIPVPAQYRCQYTKQGVITSAYHFPTPKNNGSEKGKANYSRRYTSLKNDFPGLEQYMELTFNNNDMNPAISNKSNSEARGYAILDNLGVFENSQLLDDVKRVCDRKLSEYQNETHKLSTTSSSGSKGITNWAEEKDGGWGVIFTDYGFKRVPMNFYSNYYHPYEKFENIQISKLIYISEYTYIKRKNNQQSDLPPQIPFSSDVTDKFFEDFHGSFNSEPSTPNLNISLSIDPKNKTLKIQSPMCRTDFTAEIDRVELNLEYDQKNIVKVLLKKIQIDDFEDSCHKSSFFKSIMKDKIIFIGAIKINYYTNYGEQVIGLKTQDFDIGFEFKKAL